MLNKKIIIIIYAFSILFIIFFIIRFYLLNINNNINIEDKTNQNKIRIAVCPTFYDYGLENFFNSYELIKTNSTAESLNLLNNNYVDYILAGRKLKPNEKAFNLEGKILEKIGYSFLSNIINNIEIKDFDDYIFYTDLDLSEIKKDLNINNIEKVENVYIYLNKGIIITSIENTDYNKTNLVHVFELNGDRLKLSRTPILYNKIK